MDEVVNFEESPERFKVVIKLRVNWILLSIYALAMLAWLVMLALVLSYLFRGRSTSLVLTALLLLWLVLWAWLGRFLWNRLQYHSATREILFIDEEQLLVRRPLSIFGITTSYDIDHVSPFYFHDKHSCPAFDYGYLHVYFGTGLSEQDARELIAVLNARYFPAIDEGAEN